MSHPRDLDNGATEVVIELVRKERERQCILKVQSKFLWSCDDNVINYKEQKSADQPSYRIISDAEKLAVLVEEFGEVSKEVTDSIIEIDKYQSENLAYPPHRVKYRRDLLRKELIQVAAVCVAWVEGLDKLESIDTFAKADKEKQKYIESIADTYPIKESKRCPDCSAGVGQNHLPACPRKTPISPMYQGEP